MKSFLNNIWNSVSYLGVHDEFSGELKRNIILTNRFAFTWFFIILPTALIYAFHDYLGLVILFALSFYQLLVLYLNKKQFYNLSRLLETILPQTALIIMSIFLFTSPAKDKLAIFYFLNLAFLCLPFIFFSLHEYKYLVISLIYSISCYLCFDWLNGLFNYENASLLGTYKWFEVYNYFLACGIIIFGFTYIRYISESYLKKYEKQLEELQLQKEEILQQESNFKEIFNSGANGIIIADMNGNILELNEIEFTRLNFRKDPAVTKTVMSAYFGGAKDVWNSMVNQLKTMKIHTLEIEYEISIKKTVPLEIRARLFSYKKQECVLLYITDISESRQNKQLILKAIYDTEEKEKKRFAQDLHDGLGGVLAAISLYMSTIEKTEIAVEQKVESIVKVKELLGQASETVRDISRNFVPAFLENEGLVPALNDLIEKVEFVSPFKINFDSQKNEYALSKDHELTVYRVLSELFTNSLKHGKSSKVELRIFDTGLKIFIMYSDYGVGFNYNEVVKNKKAGMGLSNIASRLQSIDAKFAINAIPDSGMDVVIELNHS
jgi:signal transduction histidine kinase